MIALLFLTIPENCRIIEENGRYWISQGDNCPTGNIEIPAEDENGHTITGIYEQGFYWCDEITSVKLPDTIEEIGYGAFYGTGITSITIPTNVTVIPGGCFGECYLLTTINLPESLSEIGSGAFLGTGITSITIPPNVTVIPSTCFFGCSSLTTINLPESLSEIDSEAFSDCSSLV